MNSRESMTNFFNLVQASKYLTFINYSTVFILGSVGNLLTIVLFISLKIFHRNQCTFYLITQCTADLVLIFVAAPLRIAEFVYGYDPMRLSDVWCRLRQSLIPCLTLISLSSTCLAAVDQYFSTNYRPRLRQYSSLSISRRLMSTMIIIWILHTIPFLVYFHLDETAGCIISNRIFLRYYSFVFFCLLIGFLPIFIAGLAAALAFLNVRRLIRRQIPQFRRRLDRQLTAMVLTKVFLFVFTLLPFTLFRTYSLNASTKPNDFYRLSIDQLIFVITSSLFYFNSANTFYIFLFVSKRFRQQTKHWIKKIFKTQVAPTLETNDLSM